MAYDYQYDLAAVAVTLMLFIIYWSRKNLNNRSNRLFLALIVCNLLATITDILSIYSISYPESVPRWFASVTSMSYLYFFNMMGVLFLVYLDSKTKISKLRKPIRILAYSVTLLYFLLIFLSPWTHAVAYFDESGQYAHGPLMDFLYVSSLVLLIIPIICFVLQRKHFSWYQTATSFGLLVSMIVCVIVQSIWTRVLVGTLGCSIALTFAYVAYENPAYYSFRDTPCLNRKAFLEIIKSRSDEGKDILLFICSIQDFNYLSKSLGINQQENLTNRVAEFMYSQFGRKAFCIQDGLYVVLVDSGLQMLEYTKVMDNYLKNPILISNREVLLRMNLRLLEIKAETPMSDMLELIQYTASVKENDTLLPAEEILASNRRRQQLIHILNRAIKQDEFEVYYQPVMNVKEGRFLSAEALVRLRDEELGFISPEEFIPLAEENNLIHEIGELVFGKVCRFIHSLRDTSLTNIRIGVNLSPLQCARHLLAERYTTIMEAYCIRPDQIVLELTETSHFTDNDTMTENIQKLSDMGIRFYLDDFGSGYASLDYLFRLPVDVVKIDKSILWKAMEDEHAMLIFTSTVELLKQLKKEIVVEGVETEEMVRLSCSLGCDYLQGYFYSKPIDEARYTEFLNEHA